MCFFSATYCKDDVVTHNQPKGTQLCNYQHDGIVNPCDDHHHHNHHHHYDGIVHLQESLLARVAGPRLQVPFFLWNLNINRIHQYRKMKKL